MNDDANADDYGGWDGDDDEAEEDDFDCHMDRDGYCGKAGSEECEFECPYRDNEEQP